MPVEEDILSKWPIAIIEDRYGGTYSGGNWIAIASFDPQEHNEYIMEKILGDDVSCSNFWFDMEGQTWLAVGSTPNEALEKLRSNTPYTNRSFRKGKM